MKRAIQILILTLIALVMSFPLYAQAVPTIESGQTVTLQITDRNYAVPYQFTGKRGDVIVAYTQPASLSEDFYHPILKLLNSRKEALADTLQAIDFGGATLAFELPADDTYTLVVTREDGASGHDKGSLTLYFSRLDELTTKHAILDLSTSGSHSNYYLIRQSDHPLTLTYQKVDGDATPDITVNALRAGTLGEVITLSGERLTQGEMTLPTDIDPIVIAVGGFIYNIRPDQKITYQLTLS